MIRVPHPDPVVATFDRHARWYDIQLWAERRALRVAAALAGPLAGARVVDLAAGTGGLGAALLERGPPPASLTAVDASPRMLERAQRRLEPLGTPLRLIVCDVRSVPLEDACSDVVALGYLLHLLDRDARDRALKEARRLLRPGGVLVAVVHGSPPGGAGRAYRAAWRLAGRLLGRSFIGGGPMTDLVPLLAAHGLEVEAARRVAGIYWSEVARARRPRAAAQR
jgi:ubiquinone/menaquinone biosynthesis C-methylase UbiE